MDLLSGWQPSSSSSSSSTEAEKQLRPIITDDNIQILSSFELNSFASLTFNDKTCDDIYEFLQKVCSQPTTYSPLSIQKSLVVVKHTLVYGSEKTVNHAYAMQHVIKALLEFNTVLLKQQQGQGWWMSIQGGGVDKGGPVRDAASEVIKLLGNINELRNIRNAKASQESLVPLGSNDEIAFVSDQVRHHILKKRMEKEQQQRQIQIKSNLVKAENGWGAGYNSQDGKSVVGAAHGIDAMIEVAKSKVNKTAKKTFSDNNNNNNMPSEDTIKAQEELRILEELKAEALEAEANNGGTSSGVADTTGDLLGSFDPNPSSTGTQPQQQVDLLDFGTAATATTSTATSTGYPSHPGGGDLLGGGLATSTMPVPPTTAPAMNNAAQASALDPFSSVPVNPTYNSSGYAGGMSPQLSGGGPSGQSMQMGVTADPFAPQPATQQAQPIYGNVDGLAANLGAMSVTSTPGPINNNMPPAAGSSNINDDRFSALDALAATTTTTTSAGISHGAPVTAAATTPTDSSYAAESRILGGLSQPSSGLTMGGSTNLPPTMGMGVSIQQPTMINPNMVTPGSGHVAKAYGNPGDTNSADADNPWVMGGVTGTGLQPLAPAPGAPPPPPPPPEY